ncbi:hypothetical protein M422DRAFT_271622 [Sphaerobolus stellatus SS14]|uniref:Unplaced genomic scaffold SPHSTscaffold_267, whole genome shotgun sequence n=1 Tax=Sphaerobolus stellatus (strain SS14) TaxID=990650 RepID=A0A0C9UPH0_SPHS4|nr:hypothetical protein M422DRAFT_271622 [Sphaerobolus stellatus SS14]
MECIGIFCQDRKVTSTERLSNYTTRLYEPSSGGSDANNCQAGGATVSGTASTCIKDVATINIQSAQVISSDSQACAFEMWTGEVNLSIPQEASWKTVGTCPGNGLPRRTSTRNPQSPEERDVIGYSTLVNIPEWRYKPFGWYQRLHSDSRSQIIDSESR